MNPGGRPSSRIALFMPYAGVVTETYLERLVKDLDPGNVVVVCQLDEGGWGSDWRTTIPTLVLGEHFGTRYEADKFAVSDVIFRPSEENCARIEGFLTENQVGLVFSQFLDFSVYWAPYFRKRGIPFFSYAHGQDLSLKYRDPEWRERYREFQFATGLVTVNNVGRERLMSLGVTPDRIRRIPCGSVNRVRSLVRAQPTPTATRLLTVGRMIPKKGILQTLEAFRLALAQGARLHLDIVGHGPLMSQVITFIMDHKLGDLVTVHGQLSHSETLVLFSHADVYVQHSVTDPENGNEEGLPVSIVEALSFGVPVVATYHAGIPEIITHEQTGLLGQENDVRQMAESLSRLSKESDLRRQYGLAGHQFFLDNLTWDKQRRDLLDFLLDQSLWGQAETSR